MASGWRKIVSKTNRRHSHIRPPYSRARGRLCTLAGQVRSVASRLPVRRQAQDADACAEICPRGAVGEYSNVVRQTSGWCPRAPSQGRASKVRLWVAGPVLLSGQCNCGSARQRGEVAPDQNFPVGLHRQGRHRVVCPGLKLVSGFPSASSRQC